MSTPLRFGGDARGDERRIGHRPLDGIEQRPLEFAHGEVVEIGAMGEQFARFLINAGLPLKAA